MSFDREQLRDELVLLLHELLHLGIIRVYTCVVYIYIYIYTHTRCITSIYMYIYIYICMYIVAIVVLFVLVCVFAPPWENWDAHGAPRH